MPALQFGFGLSRRYGSWAPAIGYFGRCSYEELEAIKEREWERKNRDYYHHVCAEIEVKRYAESLGKDAFCDENQGWTFRTQRQIDDCRSVLRGVAGMIELTWPKPEETFYFGGKGLPAHYRFR